MTKTTPSQASRARPGRKAWAGLALAVLGISGTSTTMKLAGTDPLVTTFWRLALAALILFPVHRARRRRAGNTDAAIARTLRDGRVIAAGAFLALHFVLWVSSLSRTSVLSSLVFVTMDPLFVAVLDTVMFRERTSRLLWAAVLVALCGGVFIAVQAGAAANLGNLLALGGALAASFYLVVGRSATRTMDAVSYNLATFSWAALFAGLCCLVARRPVLPLSPASFLWLALTAVLGQTVGHGLINASLASFQPQFVSLMMLWEPILGSLLAFLVLGDRPGHAELLGGAIILAGLALGILAAGREAPARAGPASST